MKEILFAVCSTAFLIQIVQWACLSRSAFPKDEAATMLELRHELIHPHLSIQGALIADQGTVRIEDFESGKVYRIANVKALLEMYQLGTRNVTVEASLQTPDTIEVSSISRF